MKRTGFYIIKDSFFEDMDDPYLKGNKEGNRPHYYCLEDKDGLFWMIPLSSRVEKYKKIMERKKKLASHVISYILLDLMMIGKVHF